MIYEIIFCFFSVFGIMQILGIIKDFFIAKIPKNITMVIGVDENTDVCTLGRDITKGVKVVFVYSDETSEKLKFLKRKFEYASFVKREKLSDEVLKLI